MDPFCNGVYGTLVWLLLYHCQSSVGVLMWMLCAVGNSIGLRTNDNQWNILVCVLVFVFEFVCMFDNGDYLPEKQDVGDAHRFFFFLCV